MKEFFKDYSELCKETGRFYKKHWIGTIAMNLVASGVMIAAYLPKDMRKEAVDKVKSKFKK